MTAGLKVVSPGLSSTIQDVGRTGFRDAGVPASGPLDRIAFTLANALVGNGANAAAIEIRMQGPVLDVLAVSVRVALVGGTGGLVLEGEGVVAPGQSVRLSRGSRVRCGALGDVGCAYLAVAGGIAVPMCLGSASTYVPGRIGGLRGDVLQPGDVLPVVSDNVDQRPERALMHPFDPMGDAPIRVVLGPQDDYFTDDAIVTLLSATYTISPRADRMGFRLQGPTLAHAKGFNIVSDGIVAGAIQVPGSGEPIVLLADAQTTGGYPKIATVISADVPLIGRRRPGAAVRFVAVTQEAAEQARREQEQMVARWIGEMREVDDRSGIDHDALYSANLVDGVSDGRE